jgi:hypothetical protein
MFDALEVLVTATVQFAKSGETHPDHNEKDGLLAAVTSK